MQHVFTLFNVTNVAFVIENGMTATDCLDCNRMNSFTVMIK